MKKYVFIYAAIAACALSCRIQPNSDRKYSDGDATKAYTLRLTPPVGSKFYFGITSQSEFRLEVDDKKVDKQNKTNAGIYYTLNKDSAGDLVLGMQYDKIHIHLKDGDNESDMDAANAAGSSDVVEKLLGSLKEKGITMVVSPTGVVRSVSGLKEMEDGLMAQFSSVSSYDKNAMKGKWDKLISEELVGRNMDQLFRIFPDSSVHIGDKWQRDSRQKGEIGVTTRNTYTLQAIRDGVAYIDSEGTITSDSVTNYMGYDVTTNLKGQQRAEYQLEMRTGMVLNATINAKIDGSLQLLGRDIPLTLENSVKIERH
jgi:hypothetical protein